jgi:light-regulated signal transduction histidine kinase (bacteriophytochrome)
MSALVKGLLNFSRIGRQKTLSHIDVNKLITHVIEDLQTLIAKSNAEIHVGKMPELNLYELEFGQLLQNLITNAIKFQKIDSKPQIDIRSEEIKGKWQFSVTDNGIGIAPTHFDRIFDIFQRLHINGEYEGNGIGLANCKKIVEQHQGKIWIESVLGNGTTIYFTISNLSK